jgi:uncharacterized protein (TIGR02646 family)
MVRINRRTPAPPLLTQNRDRWTVRWQEICAAGTGRDWATRRAKRLLQEALHPLSFGKCTFCEGLLGVTTDLEVEHYYPKIIRTDLAFAWINLLPSCRLCNRSKRDQDHQGALLKPDEEDPEPFFWIHPDTGKLEADPSLDEPARHRAMETIRLCDLQRPALCIKRLETMQRVGRWLRQVAGRRRLSGVLKEEWEALSNPSFEFKLAVRHQLSIMGQPDLALLDRERFNAATGV